MTTNPVTLADIQAARERIAGSVIRTPLIKLNVDNAPAEIYLKLENLQPIGSFKLRGAANAIGLATPEQLAKGVYTCSAGNMAQGVAWNARRLGIPSTAVVPDHAPETKLAAIKRLGGEIIKVPFDEWWNVMVTHQYAGLDGLFVHPVSDPAVMAGNGTIGLEILEDLPDVDTIIVPYGGGGLSCGIATAVKALKPNTLIYAGEVETSAAFAGALAAGEKVAINYQASFVDGIGSGSVLDDMWPLAKMLLDGSLVMSLAEVAEAVRLLAERNRVIAEGAGATGVAAALAGKAGGGKVVCVVSGGNIDFDKLTKIFKHEI
ncbi:MAG: pyridoxal-phosphate dependent enzyme [Chloroflexi bacterium]|nr:pyridoxal-phosphate dependent enzyme [Chloroflexota bacterium]MCC6895821.1 pyridoxal-phosphate dependent enzyme [Anaerolineae bacterium]